MTPPTVMTNAEIGVRDWLKAQPAVAAAVGNRIFLGVPPELARAGEGGYPLIGIHRLYSLVERYLPVDVAVLQLDCWGPMKSQRSAYTAASAAAAALWSLTPNTPLGADMVAKGVTDITSQWFPDPISDRPRYIVTATVLVVAT